MFIHLVFEVEFLNILELQSWLEERRYYLRGMNETAVNAFISVIVIFCFSYWNIQIRINWWFHGMRWHALRLLRTLIFRLLLGCISLTKWWNCCWLEYYVSPLWTIIAIQFLSVLILILIILIFRSPYINRFTHKIIL